MGLAGSPTASRRPGAGGLFRREPENNGQKRGSLGGAPSGVAHYASHNVGSSRTNERYGTSGPTALRLAPTAFRRTCAGGPFGANKPSGAALAPWGYFAFRDGRGPGRLRLFRNNGWSQAVLSAVTPLSIVLNRAAHTRRITPHALLASELPWASSQSCSGVAEKRSSLMARW